MVPAVAREEMRSRCEVSIGYLTTEEGAMRSGRFSICSTSVQYYEHLLCYTSVRKTGLIRLAGGDFRRTFMLAAAACVRWPETLHRFPRAITALSAQADKQADSALIELQQESDTTARPRSAGVRSSRPTSAIGVPPTKTVRAIARAPCSPRAAQLPSEYLDLTTC